MEVSSFRGSPQLALTLSTAAQTPGSCLHSADLAPLVKFLDNFGTGKFCDTIQSIHQVVGNDDIDDVDEKASSSSSSSSSSGDVAMDSSSPKKDAMEIDSIGNSPSFGSWKEKWWETSSRGQLDQQLLFTFGTCTSAASAYDGVRNIPFATIEKAIVDHPVLLKSSKEKFKDAWKAVEDTSLSQPVKNSIADRDTALVRVPPDESVGGIFRAIHSTQVSKKTLDGEEEVDPSECRNVWIAPVSMTLSVLDKLLKLGEYYGQVNHVSLIPNRKAAVITFRYPECASFCVNALNINMSNYNRHEGYVSADVTADNSVQESLLACFCQAKNADPSLTENSYIPIGMPDSSLLIVQNQYDEDEGGKKEEDLIEENKEDPSNTHISDDSGLDVQNMSIVIGEGGCGTDEKILAMRDKKRRRSESKSRNVNKSKKKKKNASKLYVVLAALVPATSVPLAPGENRKGRPHSNACICKHCLPAAVRTVPDQFAESLTLITDFLTKEEEAEILKNANESEWEFNQKGIVASMQRRVQHYGYAFDYTTRLLDIDNPREPFPVWISESVNRMEPYFVSAEGEKVPPNQMTIQEYPAGKGIDTHVDSHSSFLDPIASLSLGSSCVMAFINPATGERKDLFLPPRSLLVIRGEARYVWCHKIPKRQTDKVEGIRGFVKRGLRVSITFRRANKALRCSCPYQDCCDDQLQRKEGEKDDALSDANYIPSLLKTKDGAKKLEREHVQGFYDRIAPHFSATRHSPWPIVAHFLKLKGTTGTVGENYEGIEPSVTPGDIIGDIGCGNGKYLKLLPKRHCSGIGCDVSSRLVELCHNDHYEVLSADGMTLPFRDNGFDITLNIAVFHHISTPERRNQLASELVRVTRPGGLLLVYAWSFEQEEGSRRQFETQDCFVPWHMPTSFDAKHTSESSGQEAASESNVATDLHEKQQSVGSSSDAPSPSGSSTSAAEGIGLTKGGKSYIVLQRYCHVFRKGELEELFAPLNVSVVNSYFDHANWCVLLQKNI